MAHWSQINRKYLQGRSAYQPLSLVTSGAFGGGQELPPSCSLQGWGLGGIEGLLLF